MAIAVIFLFDIGIASTTLRQSVLRSWDKNLLVMPGGNRARGPLGSEVEIQNVQQDDSGTGGYQMGLWVLTQLLSAWHFWCLAHEIKLIFTSIWCVLCWGVVTFWWLQYKCCSSDYSGRYSILFNIHVKLAAIPCLQFKLWNPYFQAVCFF